MPRQIQCWHEHDAPYANIERSATPSRRTSVVGVSVSESASPRQSAIRERDEWHEFDAPYANIESSSSSATSAVATPASGPSPRFSRSVAGSTGFSPAAPPSAPPPLVLAPLVAAVDGENAAPGDDSGSGAHLEPQADFVDVGAESLLQGLDADEDLSAGIDDLDGIPSFPAPIEVHATAFLHDTHEDDAVPADGVYELPLLSTDTHG